MSNHILGDATAQALEPFAFQMRIVSAPDATTAARAATFLAGSVKIGALGTVASNALAAAVTTSISARSVVSRPGADPSRNDAYRAIEPFQRAGAAPLASILDNLDGPAMTALSTALATRAT